MPKVDFDVEQVECAIAEVLQEALDGLPPQCAWVSVKRPPEIEEGVRFEIAPSSSSSAPIAVHFVEDLPIAFEAGEDAVIELSHKGRWYTDLPFREELRILCSSVIAGDFEETLWRVNERVIKSRARIRIQDKWHTFCYRRSFHPFRRTTMKHIRYSPYSTP